MEYKSILLVEDDECMSEDHPEILNKYFEEGWEYVDSITQPIASGNYSYRAGVIVVLKRDKVSL